MNCERFDAFVFSDNATSLAEIEQHVQSCSECRGRLSEWQTLSRVALELHESWESPELWNRIETAIREERTAAKTPVWTLFAQWAAVALIVISLGVTIARTIGPGRANDDRSRVEEWILRESAIAEVEKAERAHIKSIERLSKLVSGQVQEPATPLEVSYREKLLLLDEAILECQAEIERNRYNAHLRRQLLSVYDEKDKTLRQMLEDKR